MLCLQFTGEYSYTHAALWHPNPHSNYTGALLRANLPIIVGLQVVSNPLNSITDLVCRYQIGRIILSVIGINVDPLNREEVPFLDDFIHAAWGAKFDNLATVFNVTSLGAIVMGIFFGLIASFATV